MSANRCEFCKKPLEKGFTKSGEEIFLCLNSQCQAQRLVTIESRLESIEQLLTFRSQVPTQVSQKKPELKVSMVARRDLENAISENILSLPNLSLSEGKERFFVLLDQFKGSRASLQSRLELVANQKYFSLRFLPQWAILMAYSGKPFLAAQRILRDGNSLNVSFLQNVISRANSVRPSKSEALPLHKFFTRVFYWAVEERLPQSTLDLLQAQIQFLHPESDPLIKPSELPVSPRPSASTEVIGRPFDLPSDQSSPSSPSWFNRFRPEEGWEFAIGANWLRWVGIGAILFSLFGFIMWSSTRVQLSEAQKSMMIFLGVFLLGIIFHVFSFLILRFKVRNQYIPSIAYSLAFLAIGIYFLLLFALRFHPFSPVGGDDLLYYFLCILLILIVVITAWGHDSSLLFLESFFISLWLIWHLSTQLFVNNLTSFALFNWDFDYLFGFLWINFALFLLIFIGIAFRRRDMVFTAFIQLSSLFLLFLPNSSDLLVENRFSSDINGMMILLVFLILLNLIVSYIFPLGIPDQFFDLFTREHLSLTSVTPVFASFFLLHLGDISGAVFLPLFLIFTTAFVSLAFRQKDLGVAFVIVLFAQLFWFLSLGFMDDIVLVLPEVNGSLIVLVYLTFFNWLVAREFPSEVHPRFWETINRKHLTLIALGPIFLSFFINILGFVTNTIFVIYLILVCILWSSNRDTTIDISSFSIRKVSMFDFVTYFSVFLFLLTVIIQPGEDMIGLILGFALFPFLLLISQNYSQMSIDLKLVQEFYSIINSTFLAVLFLILILKDSFTQFAELVHSFISIPELLYSHNWAFLGFLWIICVLLITTKNFYAYIINDETKFILGLIPLVVMHLYVSMSSISESMTLVYVVVCYGYLFILYFLFALPSTQDSTESSSNYRFILPLLAIVQIIIFLQQLRLESSWNIFIVIFITLVTPFSFGYLLILRKQINHLVDSYFVLSAAGISVFQFYLLDSVNSSDGWMFHTITLLFSLIYLLTHLFRVREEFLPIDKDHFGLNFLLFSSLGFINTIVCYGFFGAILSPIFSFLIFDILVLFSLLFGLYLLGIERYLVLANGFTIYGASLLLRLPLIDPITESEFFSFIVLGFLFQVVVHGFLIGLGKTIFSARPEVNNWHLDLTTRETWYVDSYKLMAILNPLIFYLCLLQLSTKGLDILEMADILPLLMIAFSVLIGVYYVFITRIGTPRTISDSGLFFSLLIIWGYTLFWPELMELFYFSAGATAFLCILYGFWVMKREWRIVGLGIIGLSIGYSAVYLAQLTETLQTIVGFGLLGLISVAIGLVYSKFASRFETDTQTD